MKKLKPLNKCDEKFWSWFSNEYSKLPEGEDFPVSDENIYELWSSAWPTAYATGLARGQKQGRMHVEERTPMPYYTMEDLFVGCSNGREFGLKIERWHGIFPECELLRQRRI